MHFEVNIAIPTLNGGALLQQCIQSLGIWQKNVWVLDSGSTDGTLDFLRLSNLSYDSVSTGTFNHGATRELARLQLKGKVVVFLTQDAVVTQCDSIDRLVAPILSGEAEICYGRQLARPRASFFETFPREFNYPPSSHTRCLKDIKQYGAFTFFCSNAFAAYSQKALDEIGGFEPTLTHEDYFAVAKIMQNGGRIAYVAEAEVIHSHEYFLWQEFQRYFDAGYVRAVNPWVTDLVGQAENHGSRFFKALLKRLAKEDPKLIPYAILQTSVKWLGYRGGYLCFRGPTWLKKWLSGQSYYFDSKYYVSGKN